ncbi:MAG: PLP-dependent aminotransferase family protein [Eubacteriaceae bacterium]|jgi:2-aminoadipate transaminase|nr:PLP-dependent aminotransferase family protein [Eubacteriaceae bacterium]
MMRFSKRMDMIKPSAIRSVQKRIAATENVISFAAGLPDPALFPLDDLEKATSKMIREKGELAFQYGLTKGYDPMIDKLVERMRNKEKIDASAANIILTTGSQQGLALCAMMFLDEGDVVVAENPSYLGGINACRPYGVSFIGVDTDDEGMDTKELDKVLAENPSVKMLYVIPNFQNPTGKAWSLQRRKDFMEVINKYDVIVVEDNPYGEIRFKGDFVPSLKSMDTQGKVVYLGSFSKILAPGLRIAWICADPEVVKEAELIKEGWDLQCNQFVQVQAVQYMEDFDLEAHIAEIQQLYMKKCDLMLEMMDKEFPESVTYTRPEGGMFIWVVLPENVDADVLLDTALEHGVAYIPGEPFFANGGPKNTIRMNFTTVSEDQIKKGIKILGDVLKTVC